MSLPVAILAGGEAKRLHPITQSIPKALVEVAGRPFIEHQLAYLRDQGISRVVLCVGYLGDQIESAIGDGSRFGIDVSYSWDGPRLLGTGGAVRRALPMLGSAFMVYYGDTYLPIDFREVAREFLARGKPGLMTVLRNKGQWDTSNVFFRDGAVIEYNKRQPKPGMEYIDYGLGVLSASVLHAMPANESFDLGDVYHDLSLRGQLAGLEVVHRFHEVGSHDGLRETIAYFQGKAAE